MDHFEMEDLSFTDEEPMFPGNDDDDEDKTYEPDLLESDNSEDEQPSNNGFAAVERPRKRKRNEKMWKRKRASNLRNSGLEYKDRKGKLHEARRLIDYVHQCRYGCNNKFNDENRSHIFNEYWALNDWNLQTSFLFNAVTATAVMRKKIDANKNKNVSVQYTLGGLRVCKQFLVKTLGISNRRLDYVVQKKTESTGAGIAPKDSRGKARPGNKLPDQTVETVMSHIRSFPFYTSHYSRHKNPHVRYLNSNLNLRLMYVKYKEKCQENDILPVKESFYRYIFNTKFNYTFKKPNTDTCNTCDILKNQVDHAKTPNEKSIFLAKKELHLRKAESARTAKEEAVKQAEKDKSKIVIVFDLQKTLPTPVLSCSKVYYCRQLWTYNLCIHNVCTGEATMFMWDESQYSRGCLAIASCIFKFVKSLSPEITHIIAFSDNCGGQNKSSLIVKFWSWLTRTTNIKVVDHKFFIPGHSYNECDRDFGLIEKAKKFNSKEIFIPQHWSAIIAKSSKKFIVVKMAVEDFINLEPIMSFFIKDIQGISQFQWLQFTRDKPFTLFHSSSVVTEMVHFETMNIAAKQLAKNKVNLEEVVLPQLGVNRLKNKIQYNKYVDLQSLLPFIPPVHHAFYQKLPHLKKGERLIKPVTRRKSSQPGPSNQTNETCEHDENEEFELDTVMEYEDDFSI